jgi:hypothetical protein
MAYRRGHGKRHFSHQHGLSRLHFHWSTPGTHVGVVLNVPAHRTHTTQHVHAAQPPRYRAQMRKGRQSVVTTEQRSGRNRGKGRRHTGF